MTTNNSSSIKDESSAQQEINRDTEIHALKKIISILSTKNTSLNIAIEKILSVPTNLNIAESILKHSTCSDLEKNNNIVFLSGIEQKAFSYYKENFEFDIDAFKDYSLPSIYLEECIATGENKSTYLLNRYTEDIFSKLFLDFINNPERYNSFKTADSSLQKSELDRLNSHLKTIVELYLYKAMSTLAHRYYAYDVALMYHDFLMVTYSGGTINVSYDSGEYFKNKLSKENTKAANTGAKDKQLFRQKKKKQYLQIMKEKAFTSYAKTAEYIKLNIDTDESPTYRTVEKWLSQADKGDFS